MTKFYAGLGSRKTPHDVLKLMTQIAERLSSQGWILRSGHADGADLAFERGAKNNAEIFLPWASFNSHYPIQSQTYIAPTQAAMTVAQRYHPKWTACSSGARLLHARNSHQILGYDLESPVKFVICWAPLDDQGRETGGTAQALRLARTLAIPVFNLVLPEHRQRLERFCAPDHSLVA